MADCWKGVVLATLAAVCVSQAEVETLSLLVQLEDGAQGFNISIPGEEEWRGNIRIPAEERENSAGERFMVPTGQSGQS
ncbi:hypothetical protein J6590_049478 [Homalodisca vitripennis]|nr:hypothetical protein J6590_049478 [Homalodisca vitripennis]